MKMQKKKKKEKTEKKKKKRRRHRSASRVLCPTNKKLVLPLPFPLFPKVGHLPGGADLGEKGEGEGGGGGGHKQAKKSPNQAQEKKMHSIAPCKKVSKKVVFARSGALPPGNLLHGTWGHEPCTDQP